MMIDYEEIEKNLKKQRDNGEMDFNTYRLRISELRERKKEQRNTYRSTKRLENDIDPN